MWKVITSLAFVVLTNLATANAAKQPIIDLASLQKANWTAQELENAEVITDFVQNLMNNHNFDYVLQRYNDSA